MEIEAMQALGLHPSYIEGFDSFAVLSSSLCA